MASISFRSEKALAKRVLLLSAFALILIAALGAMQRVSWASSISKQNFSALGTVSGISADSISITGAQSSDGTGRTDYTFATNNVKEIENRSYGALTSADIAVGDSIIAQGLDFDGNISIYRIISLAPATTTEDTAAASTTSAASSTVATSTARTSFSSVAPSSSADMLASPAPVSIPAPTPYGSSSADMVGTTTTTAPSPASSTDATTGTTTTAAVSAPAPVTASTSTDQTPAPASTTPAAPAQTTNASSSASSAQ